MAAEGDGSDRGSPVLAARRPRLRRHRARGTRRSRERTHRAGRVDADAAARTESLHRQAVANARPEAEGGLPCDAARRQTVETVDPCPLPQHRLLREPGLRCRCRGANVLLEACVAAECRASGDDRRFAAGANILRPVARPGRRAHPPQRSARRDAEQPRPRAGRVALREKAAARAAPGNALQNNPRAVLLRLRRPAARLPVRPAARRERRPARPHNDRPEAAESRAAHDRPAPTEQERPGERARRDRPAQRQSARDGRLRPKRRADPVQPRLTRPSASRKRLQAVHARSDTRARQLALLLPQRATRADHHRPSLPGRLPANPGTSTTTPTRPPER